MKTWVIGISGAYQAGLRGQSYQGRYKAAYYQGLAHAGLAVCNYCGSNVSHKAHIQDMSGIYCNAECRHKFNNP